MKVVFNNCNLEFNKYVNTPVTDSNIANGYLKNIYFVGLPQSVSTLYLKEVFCNVTGQDIYKFSLENGGSDYFILNVPVATRNVPYIVRNVSASDASEFTVIIKSENISSIGDGSHITVNAEINLGRATDKYNTIQKDIDAGFTDNPNVNLLVTEMYINGSNDVKFTYIDYNSDQSYGYGVCFGKTDSSFAYQKFQLEVPNDNTVFVCSNKTPKIYAIVKWSLLPQASTIVYQTGDSIANLLGPCTINFDKATDLHYSPRIKASLE